MFLVRHGQSEFNQAFRKTRRDPGIVDPSLTPLGVKQIQQTANFFRYKDIQFCVSSPYQRALQTSALLFDLTNQDLTVNFLAGEQFGFSCDIGSPRSELESKWPQIDFEKLTEVWWPSEPETENAVSQRGALFLRETTNRFLNTDRLVVVSHWGFIKSLTGLSVENGSVVEFRENISNCVVYRPPL